MWTSAQIIAMQAVYDTLRDIQRTLYPRNRPVVDFVEPSLLSSLRVVLSELPIDPHDQVDMESRYIDPLSKAKMEDLYQKYVSVPGEEREWYSLAWPPARQPEELPSKPNERDARDYYRQLLSRLDAESYLEEEDPIDFDGETISFLDESAWHGGTYHENEVDSYENICLGKWYVKGAKWQSGGALFVNFGFEHAKFTDRKPHVQFSIIDATPFEGLLTSELLCIVTMMMRQIAKTELAEADHRLFPVLAYTYNGPQVRITQAVYDNGCLQIRQSPGFDIGCDDGDFSPVKLILRWTLGTPCGSTLWPQNQKQVQESETLAEPLLPTNASSTNIPVVA